MTTDTKQCCHCRNIKPLSEFWKDSSSKQGVDSTCKTCRKARINRVRTANNQKNYTLRNRAKQATRVLVSKLLKEGSLVKESCFLCNAPETVAHHLQYDYPDKVVWLCPPHHNEVHHEIK